MTSFVDLIDIVMKNSDWGKNFVEIFDTRHRLEEDDAVFIIDQIEAHFRGWV